MTMMKTQRKYQKAVAIFMMSLFLLFSVSLVTYAAADPADGGLVNCGKGDNVSAADQCDFQKLIELIQIITNYLIIIAAPLAALVFAYAGFKYLTAAGDTGKIEEAHGIFFKVLWGFVIMLAAWLLVKAITSGLLRSTDYSFLK